jgi:ABC-type sulfate transport system permease subunit
MRQTRGSLIPLGLAFVAAFISLVPLWYLVTQSLSKGLQPFIDEVFQERTLTQIGRAHV